MKTLILCILNWFKIQTPHTSNKVWRLADNSFIRCYLTGANETERGTMKNYHGLRLVVHLKNQPDCTGGFKAMSSHRFWIIRSYSGNFRKGGLWRKWDSLAGRLALRFHYV